MNTALLHNRYGQYAFRAAFYLALGGILVLAVLPDTESLPEVTKISDKLNHVAAFFVLALLMGLAHAGTAPRRAFFWLLGYGALIEAVQFFLPYREFSLFDLAADAAGVALYLGGRHLLSSLLLLRSS